MAPRREIDDLIPSPENDGNVNGSRDDATRTKQITDDAKNTDSKHPIRPPILSTTTTLCILVMIDMFSVSLVVPLLHEYYKNAGVHSASQREMLSSLYSSSQIAGGLIIGALSDVGMLSRRRILFLSFLGSALSYALIVVGGLRNLIISRVLVGLVKQTMTVSTSLLARHTTSETRAVSMGRLGASTTVAWIVGPSVGALLYKHVGPSAPALTASGMFLLNSALAAILLPADDESVEINKMAKRSGSKKGGKFTSFTSNLKTCFSSSALASVVVSLLLFGWVTRTTSYANMASFYEEKYGIEPHYRGYIKSYQQFLNFLVQSFLVRALLSASGGERKAACIAAVVLAGATLCEVTANFGVFVSIVCPLVAVAVGTIGVSLRSLVTQVTPKESIGSVLAALDVLQNAASVTVPFYRTLLFNIAAHYGPKDADALMVGDPEPRIWLLSSFLHWSVFAIGIALLLSPAFSSRGRDVHKKNK
mmetsp:Transcript_19307/g.41919  ORF Transcript_19307/g.41919 Transcript_19307/m.41919 type:complete len:478 (+) Transcript_19307:199-1632(+)